MTVCAIFFRPPAAVLCSVCPYSIHPSLSDRCPVFCAVARATTERTNAPESPSWLPEPLISREQAAMQRFLEPRCRVQELGRFLDPVCQPCPSSRLACDRCQEFPVEAVNAPSTESPSKSESESRGYPTRPRHPEARGIIAGHTHLQPERIQSLKKLDSWLNRARDLPNRTP